MNRRKVKKWSKMARKNPGKLKPFQWRYLMKSWEKTFKEADSVAQHAIIKTMGRAFGETVSAWLQGLSLLYKAMKPIPKAQSGTVHGRLSIVGDVGPEIIVNELGNYQLSNDTKSFRKGEKFIVNGEEFTAQ